jgi:hypothetical protein
MLNQRATLHHGKKSQQMHSALSVFRLEQSAIEDHAGQDSGAHSLTG